jgi:hypothetical protein
MCYDENTPAAPGSAGQLCGVEMLLVLAVILLLFELWYTLAYLYAYAQTQERILLAPALQGLVMSVAVTVVVLAMLQLMPFSGWLVLTLFVSALLLSLVWRVGIGKTQLAQSYPRGVADILMFRRPAADLKRRVRSK